MTCNCPESGTSGSCPFHDASTRFTVEPQPGRWDTRLVRIVTELEDAAYQRGRAEATAAAEQRLDVGRLRRAIFGIGLIPDRNASNDHVPWEEWERESASTLAEQLAAEYARLTLEPSTPKEPE